MPGGDRYKQFLKELHQRLQVSKCNALTDWPTRSFGSEYRNLIYIEIAVEVGRGYIICYEIGGSFAYIKIKGAGARHHLRYERLPREGKMLFVRRRNARTKRLVHFRGCEPCLVRGSIQVAS